MDSDDRLFSPPSNYFNYYSFHHASSVPTVKVANYGKGIVRRRNGLWVEDRRGQLHRHVTIGTLPDDILLEIFNFCGERSEYDNSDNWWQKLVHVCRRWRNVVFASPHRLNLQLICTRTTSVREMLDTWPKFPVIIQDDGFPEDLEAMEGVDNVIAALELNDRVSEIRLWAVSSPELKRLVAVKQDPFPALTKLWLESTEEIDEMAPVISDSFLGGSAPRLQFLQFCDIPFPALPNLLLTATDLVDLRLFDIPHSGHISPGAMVICLSTLTRLESLILEFQSPRSRPDRASRLPPPLTRTILPALTYLKFEGVTEYLEDLVTQIDVPLLEKIFMTFFNQLIFDIFHCHLHKFLCRTEEFTVFDRVCVSFYESSVDIELSSQPWIDDAPRVRLAISCRILDWQLSSLAQVCDSALPTLSALERLDILDGTSDLVPGKDDIENTQWLDLLRPFTNVKDLHLYNQLVPYVAPALQELTGERITEVLPALQNIFLHEVGASRPVEEGIVLFVAARHFSGHRVAIHHAK